MYYTSDFSRTWAEINLKALGENYEYAKKCTGKPVMCVIKANAYGHGAVECGRYLENIGASMFAVACLEEAMELREGGITKPILVLGYTPSEYAKLISDNDITQAAVDYDHAMSLNEEAKKHGVKVKVHIKLDTGMGRLGMVAQDEEGINTAIDCAYEIYNASNLEVKGMFTHMSVADNPYELEYTNKQIDNFIAVKEGLEKRGCKIECCHMSNSAGIMTQKRAHFDMVREGIMLYGLYPDSIPRNNGPLKPVMTLKSRVGLVKDIKKGASISYGRMFKAEKDMKSAVITVGYADGYPWQMSGKLTTMYINGKPYNQIGRVCMDMIMADVTGSDVKRDDEVILFGDGGMSIEEVAQAIGTITYEVTCAVTQRAKKVYLV